MSRPETNDHAINSHSGVQPMMTQNMLSKTGMRLSQWKIISDNKSSISSAIVLGAGDVTGRYRRSYLGAWWITINMLALAVTFYFALGRRFSIGGPNYLQYLLAGLAAWTFVAVSTTELCRCLHECRELHLAMKFPYWATCLRVVTRNLIIYGHNLAAASAAILVIGNSELSTLLGSTLRLALGIALCSGTLLSSGIFLSIICARARDLEQVIGAAMQIMFYMTPILWEKGEATNNILSTVNNYNPFYHAIELLRAPLLGKTASYGSILACLTIFAVMGMVSMITLKINRKDIVFWI